MSIFVPCFASSPKTAHDEFPMQPSFPDGILPLLQKNCQKSVSITPQFHEHPSSSSSEIRKIGMPTIGHRKQRTQREEEIGQGYPCNNEKPTSFRHNVPNCTIERKFQDCRILKQHLVQRKYSIRTLQGHCHSNPGYLKRLSHTSRSAVQPATNKTQKLVHVCDVQQHSPTRSKSFSTLISCLTLSKFTNQWSS